MVARRIGQRALLGGNEVEWDGAGWRNPAGPIESSGRPGEFNGNSAAPSPRVPGIGAFGWSPEQQAMAPTPELGALRNFGQQSPLNFATPPDPRLQAATSPEAMKNFGDLNLEDRYPGTAAPAPSEALNPAMPINPAEIAQARTPAPKYVLHGSANGVDDWMNPAIDRLVQQGRSEGLFKGPDGQVRRIIYKGQASRAPADPNSAAGAPPLNRASGPVNTEGPAQHAGAANPAPTPGAAPDITPQTLNPFNVASPLSAGNKPPAGGWASTASGNPSIDAPSPSAQVLSSSQPLPQTIDQVGALVPGSGKTRLETALENIGPVTWEDQKAYRDATRGATFLGSRDSQDGRRKVNALDSLWAEPDQSAMPEPGINAQTKDLWMRAQRPEWDRSNPLSDQVVISYNSSGPDANALASAAAIGEKLPFDPGQAFNDGFGVAQQGKRGNTIPLGLLRPDQLPPLRGSGVRMTMPGALGAYGQVGLR